MATHLSTQTMLVDRVAKLVQVFPPQLDGSDGDRRSKVTSDKIPKETAVQKASGPMTRSRTRGLSPQEAADETAQLTEATPMDAADNSSALENEHDSEDEQDADNQDAEALEPYVETEEEVAWLGEMESSPRDMAKDAPEYTQGDIIKVLDKAVQLPARYYLSPGWFQTAREKVRNS